MRRDLQASLRNPISRRYSQAAPFDFGLEYQPAAGLRRMLTGTPPVLALAAIEPGVDLLLAAGMNNVRAKLVQQSEYLIALVDAVLQPLGFQLNSPRTWPAVARTSPSAIQRAGASTGRASEQQQVLPDFRARQHPAGHHPPLHHL